MINKYQSLFGFLCEASPYDLAALDFDALCRRYHADPISVNRSLYSAVGMSGEEIMEYFIASGRKSEAELLLL